MKLRILVVEDNHSNIAAAQDQLAEHELTIVEGFDQTVDLLKQKFDQQLAEQLLKERLPKGWKFVRWFHDDMPILRDKTGFENYAYCCEPESIKEIWAGVRKDASSAPFDVVLTDVMVPKGGNKCMNEEGAALARRQGPMPYGPVIALRAIQIGVKRVGILTSGSHHHDPFVFAFDNLDSFTAGDVKVVCSNHLDIKSDDGWVKNWAELLNRLMK